jgi:25S rRNA (uracil2843-N3)-methyltransferase
MGKNGKLGKVVGKETSSRPGWRGPGYLKKPEKPKGRTAAERSNSSISEHVIPIELQQLLLNIFRDTFPNTLSSDTLKPLLQKVKQALFERDFGRAFGEDEYLQAYSIRWSPSRALCYASILADLRQHFTKAFPMCGDFHSKTNHYDGKDEPLPASAAGTPESALHITSFGGGAAEVIAFAGFWKHLHSSASPCASRDVAVAQAPETLSVADRTSAHKLDVLLVDTAQWGDVVQKLHEGLISPPPLSKYASSSAREANAPLILREDLATTFRTEDVLELSQSQLGDLLGPKPMLLTLLFTLNELYSTSIGKTTKFLLSLTSVVKPDTFLLVVDSPGSYSIAVVGKESKKYPMHWLLDHALIETQKARGEESTPNWEKVVSDDSRWYRLPEELRYPISLESMRYQLHLYRRL